MKGSAHWPSTSGILLDGNAFTAFCAIMLVDKANKAEKKESVL